MTPANPAILIRLSQAYAAAHPDESDEKIVRRAKALVESLHSVGLDVVFSSWVDDPAITRRSAEASWDPFIEGMRMIYEQNKDRQPWRPEGA